MSRRSVPPKRSLNLLEQLVTEQGETTPEQKRLMENLIRDSSGKNIKDSGKLSYGNYNGEMNNKATGRKSRERIKKSKFGKVDNKTDNKKNTNEKDIKSDTDSNRVSEKEKTKIDVPSANSPRISRSSSDSFWTTGIVKEKPKSRSRSRSRSRSYSSRSRSRSYSTSRSRSRSHSRSRSYSSSRSRSRSYSSSRSRSYSRSRSVSRSPSFSSGRSKSSEEPSKASTKSSTVKNVTVKETVQQDRDVLSDIVTTTKKKPPVGKKQRKLLKRRQLHKFRSLEIDPNEFIEERLRQKYRELNEIVQGKHMKTNTITREYIGQMESLRQQYHMVSHGLTPPGLLFPRSLPKEMRTGSYNSLTESRQSRRPMSGGSYRSVLSNNSNDVAYRSMQNVINSNPQHVYLPIKPKQKKKLRRRNSESTLEDTSTISNKASTANSKEETSPRNMSGMDRTDHHIKNSGNEKLKEWLKQKDKEHRKKLKEERAKKREEREKMVIEANEKFEKRLEAQKKYKTWLDIKNKEIAQNEKKARKEQKRILEEYYKEQEKKTITGVRPKSAQLNHRDNSKGVTVEGTSETNVNLREKPKKNDEVTPHPPASKFIYKRPVAGKIKLAVNGHNTTGQSPERPKTAPSRSRSPDKTRMSYDQWVLQKRKQDQKKKEFEEKQKRDAMSKSDPDLDKIIPDVARKRIHNVLESKKRVDTGVKRFDEKLNKQFGGADFNGDDQTNISTRSDQQRYSYQLESDRSDQSSSTKTNMTGRSVKKPPSGSRPQTAPAGRVPPPKQSSGSPRKAVVPKLDDVMNEEQTSNPFRLPFNEKEGIPKHVAAMQRKLFAEHVWDKLEAEERPEPQGSDIPEPATCVNLTKGDNLNTSDSKSKKTENCDMDVETESVQSGTKQVHSDKKDSDVHDSKVFLTQFNSTDNLANITNKELPNVDTISNEPTNATVSTSDNVEEKTSNQESNDDQNMSETVNFNGAETEKSDKESGTLDKESDRHVTEATIKEENGDESESHVTLMESEKPEIQEQNSSYDNEKLHDECNDNVIDEKNSVEKSDEKDNINEEVKTNSVDSATPNSKEVRGSNWSNINKAEVKSDEDFNMKENDDLVPDLDSMTKSSKRVSFNEDPEVFQTEEEEEDNWSTDTRTPDDDDNFVEYAEDGLTNSIDDDF